MIAIGGATALEVDSVLTMSLCNVARHKEENDWPPY